MPASQEKNYKRDLEILYNRAQLFVKAIERGLDEEGFFPMSANEPRKTGLTFKTGLQIGNRFHDIQGGISEAEKIAENQGQESGLRELLNG